MPALEELAQHQWLSEPELSYHPSDSRRRAIHPLNGLIQYGPYSASTITALPSPIRVALVAPHGALGVPRKLIAELQNTHQPKERKTYLPTFSGFERILKLKVAAASARSQLELPAQLDVDLNTNPQPRAVLAAALATIFTTLAAVRSDFDVVLMYIPEKWEPHCFPTDSDAFDLHDYVKALSAERAIPVQLIRETRAIAYPCRASVAWRLSIALYCKAGGTPWRLATTNPGVAFIGLSYAIKSTPEGKSSFVTCCSQVFDADGGGLEFILYETDDVVVERDNPYLSATEMRRVMSRSLALYQRRHAGQLPQRIVVHKTTDYKSAEIDGVFDAFQSVDGVDLLTIQDSPWRGIKWDRRAPTDKAKATGYPLERGSVLHLDQNNALLWTQGDAANIVQNKNYFKEGKGIPSPLIVRRFAGAGTMFDPCRHILGLTKLNWNHDGLYDQLPVTIRFASTLAKVAKRIETLSKQPYQFRFFM